MASLTITSVLKTLLVLLCTPPTVTPRSVKQLPITCDAEECSIGESASVTCHFGTDIRQNQRHFAVVMYPFHVEKSFSGIDVLRCHWTQPSSPECRVMDGFVFNQHITDTITVNISKATTQMAGIYACELVPSNDRTKRTCNLNVTERSPSAARMQSAPRRPPRKEGSIPEPSMYSAVRGSAEERDTNQGSFLAMHIITMSALVLLIALNVFMAMRR
ncbi:uncharacterized protein [Littorina saxatilis]|uniref:uncharacterized protein n=1 Tax=Littorina saxatilis TaxID=31220 RepID=UPI0038B58C61